MSHTIYSHTHRLSRQVSLTLPMAVMITDQVRGPKTTADVTKVIEVTGWSPGGPIPNHGRSIPRPLYESQTT